MTQIMHSIDAMAQQVQNQSKDLSRFMDTLIHESVGPYSYEDLIFTGCGDSFAAAHFGQALSGNQSLAIDPVELKSHHRKLSGKIIVFLSVSGKTRSNIELAEKVGKIAKSRVAVTRHHHSPLAQICDQTILLEFENAPILTAGTVSFTSSLIAVAAILQKLPKRLPRIEGILSKAENWASKKNKAYGEKFLFLGSDLAFSLAMYGAFKVHEVLGLHADYDYPEQFSHSKLFSVKKRYDVIYCLGQDRGIIRLAKILSNNRFNTVRVGAGATNSLLTSLQTTFCLQYVILKIARKLGLRDCAFLKDRELLNLSSNLIY